MACSWLPFLHCRPVPRTVATVPRQHLASPLGPPVHQVPETHQDTRTTTSTSEEQNLYSNTKRTEEKVLESENMRDGSGE